MGLILFSLRADRPEQAYSQAIDTNTRRFRRDCVRSDRQLGQIQRKSDQAQRGLQLQNQN